MRETIQNANGKQFHAVSLSGGKDSTAMLLLMIERDMPINMVLSADTGMEFPEMYEHLAKLDEHLFRERGIHITTLRHPKGFEYLMFDEPKQKPRSLENRAKLGIPPYGNGWPGIRVRWCTGQLKTHLITKEVNRLKGELGAIHYVGIAADEAWRCKDERYPLVEWGITEAQALQACYYRGEYNQIILDKAAESNNLVQEKYITLSIGLRKIEQTRAYFRRVDTNLSASFGRLDSGAYAISCADRLRLLHDFFRPGEEASFRFDLSANIKRGIDFRDLICPDGLQFRAGYFEMGGKFGRVLFMRDYASFISDEMIKDLSDFSTQSAALH